MSEIIKEALDFALDVAYNASKIVLEVYNQGFDVEIKEDNSPVTQADKRSDEYIRRRIKEKFPTHAILTEEGADDLNRLSSEYIWIIDPLDGTKNFVSHDDQFAINIALVQKHTPIVGVVIVPVSQEVYYASKDNGAYYKSTVDAEPQRMTASSKKDDLILLTSVFHNNEEEEAVYKMFSNRISKKRQIGSSIKACLIARGEAEVSFRFNANTKEWDTCAPQIIVEEAGGFFTEPDGTKITYNREDVYNRHGFSIYNLEDNNFSKQYLKNRTK